MHKKCILVFVGLFLSNISHANCWSDTSKRYNIPVPLLKCIVEKESNGDPLAIAKNPTSFDIGFAQINQQWLPKLKEFDIKQEDLFNACTNLQVGAWILANNFKDYGYTWRAIGIYNAGTKKDAKTEKRRIIYANKIFSCLRKGGLNV